MTASTDDRAWLPPDQAPTRKWPVVGERAPAAPCLDLDAWQLEIRGLVSTPITLPPREVIDRGRQTVTFDVHCVTRWSHRAMSFTGLPLRDLLALASPLPQARYVRFLAHSARGHDTGLPLDTALRDTWIVHAANGEPLTPEHGFPLRTVTVGRYFYKSLKWLRGIELLEAPSLGYWEREDGYHENADPWPGTERYVSGSITPEALAQFRQRTGFSSLRGVAEGSGRTLRGLDLRGWRPLSLDLRDLRLKDCDFRGADLHACDLRGANLTMGDLRGADLRDADLRGADLEGAWFAGADLRGADLGGASLNGASFFGESPDGQVLSARVDGARFAGVMGLLEAQHAWLASQPLGEPPPEGEP